MNTSINTNDIRSKNLFERLIFEKGLRAIDLRFYKKQDLIVVVLNNRKVLEVSLSNYPILKKASDKVLNDWKSVRGGIGFEWKSLNYDISLKSLLESNTVDSVMTKFQNEDILILD